MIQNLIDWVVKHGGICNVEARVDEKSGARGLYALKRIGKNEVIVQIPNKLLISPYHLTNQ